jgi:hypothetical protein
VIVDLINARGPSTSYEALVANLEPSIVMAGPVVCEPGCQPYRIVLRQKPGEYIVHTQVIPKDAAAYFYCGDYYPFSGGQETALSKALDRFADRVKRRMRFLLPAEAAERLEG